MGSRVCCCCRLLNIIYFYTCIYIRMSVRNFVYSKDLERSCGQYSVTNCRCDVSAFDLRKSMCRLSKKRCIALRRSTIDVTMCRPSKIDVSTFGDRCVDLRRSMMVDLRRSVIDVSTFEDRWSMCRPSKIDGRCEIRLLYLLKTLIL